MDTSQLLKKAWEAVEKSGVPESLQEVAFREAVENLRTGDTPASDAAGASRGKTKRTGPRKPSSQTRGQRSEDSGTPVDEATFFSRLSEESGVDEGDLRDVLSLSGRNVHVTQPTRNLGSNTSEQARTVIAVVAGARAFGLDERPVDADAVRAELKRKKCFDSGNFAAIHLGKLDGFNAGADRTEIVTTSKWISEFSAAVERALGRTKDTEGEQKE
jgi:hypothetical protein